MPVIGVVKEALPGETRVALVPSNVAQLVRDKHVVVVEEGAGESASFSDSQYAAAGARLLPDAAAVFRHAEILVKVRPPTPNELRLMKSGTIYVGFLSPASEPAIIRSFAQQSITAFAMEYIPRISRAQSMDALSSMATVAGYRAVLIAAQTMGKMFPLLMTAAGTIPPATVLVLGAGVAGLQAIATAKRLGAKVEAFDPRPAVAEQVRSLGAAFVEMELPAEEVETAGGYAKELSAEFLRKEQEAIASRISRVHAVITTAQVFGQKAPLLITADMVALMPRGSVIVDLASETGGNCALTEPGRTIVHHGVTIVGAVNLPASVPTDASQMYSRNVYNLLKHLYPTVDAPTDPEEEILRGACLTRHGAIVNEAVRALVEREG
ncbi:MAG: Re/Si-specific NAD(P)(+) transhydrogenase subunit alpha [Acidobacteria bacterium]|nr:Re/Si-specific NAD(P)(+) transhydrogenase subunit alpha [Acidobacteriota bacterium]